MNNFYNMILMENYIESGMYTMIINLLEEIGVYISLQIVISWSQDC